MTSYYSRYGRLSAATMVAYERCRQNRRSAEERLNFYLTYLEDVVPRELGVFHLPSILQPFDLRLEVRSGAPAVGREEIQLQYDGRIFMTCITSMEFNPVQLEQVAGHLAYTQYRDGFYVRDNHRAWRMFTALNDLRFFSSRDGREWDREATFEPIRHAGHVATYLQQEFDRVRHH